MPTDALGLMDDTAADYPNYATALAVSAMVKARNLHKRLRENHRADGRRICARSSSARPVAGRRRTPLMADGVWEARFTVLLKRGMWTCR